VKSASRPRRRGWTLPLLVVTTLVLGGLPVLAQADPTPASAIDWQTDVVHLTADSLKIEANDLVFTTVGAPLGYGSDPGGPDSWTLEVEWMEHDVAQWLYFYFGSDGTDWWVDQVRTRDGYPEAEWIYYEAPMLRAPLGQAFHGDVRLEGMGTGRPETGIKVPGVLTITGMTLEVSPRSTQQMYAAPPDGGIAATVDPFEPGQPLHCSGILQLDPATAHQRLLAAGYRVSYRLIHPTKPAGILLEPPEGTIEEASLGGYGEIVISVDDPALGAMPQPTWPPDCANAPSPGPIGAMDAARFAGTIDGTDGYGAPEVTYGDPKWTEEGITMRMTWAATDPRISGDVEYAANGYEFPRAYLGVDAATIVVTNQDGRWIGAGTGLQSDGEHPAPFTAILTGEGAYDGLTAYVVLDWVGSAFQGAIFPGSMPVAPTAN